ncbi:MAG: heme exporter protein CcmD [Alphaproteobacteria bacterium]|nr:heme exporter protein CcmD [Alphaproteobacteria bacterium]
MGGYAAFVWPSYGVAAVILLGLLLASRRRLRQEARALEALESSAALRRRPARREASGTRRPA